MKLASFRLITLHPPEVKVYLFTFQNNLQFLDFWWHKCANYQKCKQENCEHIPFSSIKVWSHGGWKLFIEPRPSVQSKLSARELFQPQKPFSKEQDVPQSFSSVPSPQSSMKSQVCSKAKHWPFSQDRKPEGQEPGNKKHIKYYSEFSWLSSKVDKTKSGSVQWLKPIF